MDTNGWYIHFFGWMLPIYFSDFEYISHKCINSIGTNLLESRSKGIFIWNLKSQISHVCVCSGVTFLLELRLNKIVPTEENSCKLVQNNFVNYAFINIGSKIYVKFKDLLRKHCSLSYLEMCFELSSFTFFFFTLVNNKINIYIYEFSEWLVSDLGSNE